MERPSSDGVDRIEDRLQSQDLKQVAPLGRTRCGARVAGLITDEIGDIPPAECELPYY